MLFTKSLRFLTIFIISFLAKFSNFFFVLQRSGNDRAKHQETPLRVGSVIASVEQETAVLSNALKLFCAGLTCLVRFIPRYLIF